MVIAGLVLVLLGVLAILAALFNIHGSAFFLGQDVGAVAIFFLGLGAGLAILAGYALVKHGAKRGLQHRRDQKKLGKLSTQLDQVEAERVRKRAEDQDS